MGFGKIMLLSVKDLFKDFLDFDAQNGENIANLQRGLNSILS